MELSVADMEEMVQRTNVRTQAMEAEILMQRAANAALQTQVSSLPTEGARHVSAVHTCFLEKPDVVRRHSVEVARLETRPDVAHRSVSRRTLGTGDVGRGNLEDPILNAMLTQPGAREGSELLATILVMTCRAAVLDRVVHARLGEGLTVWRSQCRLLEPRVKTRSAGVLLGLVNFDSPGDLFGGYGGL